MRPTKTTIVMFRQILLEIHNTEFNQNPFLGAFTKLRKAPINFVTSARPSVRMEELGFH